MPARKYESEKIERVKAEIHEKFLLNKKLRERIFRHREKIKQLVLEKGKVRRSKLVYISILKHLRKEAKEGVKNEN